MCPAVQKKSSKDNTLHIKNTFSLNILTRHMKSYWLAFFL